MVKKATRRVTDPVANLVTTALGSTRSGSAQPVVPKETPEPAAVPPAAMPAPLPEPQPRPSETDLNWMFDYHKPTEDQVEKYARISAAAKNLARVILQVCPPCADRSAAVRKVREARMTANLSITLHGSI